MYTIGFATEFYTIWDIKTTKEYNNDGSFYLKTSYFFIKNLSKNKEKAFTKALQEYGTSEFDSELRGTSRIVYGSNSVIDKYGNKQYDFDTMSFGKKVGIKINLIDDVDYLKSVHNKYYNERNDNIENQIKILDPSYKSEEELELIERNNTINENNKLLTGDFIEVVLLSNIKSGIFETNKGYFMLDINSNIELKTLTYNGFNYEVFAKNGKGKRLKNKTILMKFKKDINYNENLNLLVTEVKF